MISHGRGGDAGEMRLWRGSQRDWRQRRRRHYAAGGAPCVVSGREARGRGNPARVRRARPRPDPRGAGEAARASGGAAHGKWSGGAD